MNDIYTNVVCYKIMGKHNDVSPEKRVMVLGKMLLSIFLLRLDKYCSLNHKIKYGQRAQFVPRQNILFYPDFVNRSAKYYFKCYIRFYTNRKISKRVVEAITRDFHAYLSKMDEVVSVDYVRASV